MAKMNEIKELRRKTGVGIIDCKQALAESKGDLEKAVEILRRKGIAKAAKRTDRSSSEGFIASYVHQGQVGVLVELRCETDFVARNERFKEIAKDIAMHIVASTPIYLSREDIPEEVLAKEKDIYMDELNLAGKPAGVQEKILEGKLNKFYQEVCLLDQPFVKDTSKTIADMINESIAALGEKVEVGKFARVELGGK